MRKALAAAAGLFLALAPLAGAAEDNTVSAQCKPKKVEWPFFGAFGTFDRAALQRGFQIYSEVCSNCHAMHLVHYRDLAALGYNPDEIKAIAAQRKVNDTNDNGDVIQVPAKPADAFVSPFANEKAARAANNNALPPDLSLMAKAREGGPDHVIGILTGYGDVPAGLKNDDGTDFKLGNGLNYNPCMSGGQIAMPQPLSDKSVTFADGTPATLQQEATDVASFLEWAAEPKLEDRHRTGVKVIAFLFVMALVLYGVKRKVWSDLH